MKATSALILLLSALVATAQPLTLRDPVLIASLSATSGGSGSSGSTPPEIGYIVWLDASDAATLWSNVGGTVPVADGGGTNKFVARWDDKSASGTNDVFMDIPAASERRPAFSNVVAMLNNKPGLVFGCPDFTTEERTWLQTTTNNVTLGSTGITVFAVGVKIAWPTEAGDNFPMLIAHGFAGSKSWEMRVEGASGGTVTNTDVVIDGGTATTTQQGFRIGRGYAWAFRGDNRNTGNWITYRNGVAVTAIDFATDCFPQANGLSIGSRWTSAARDNCWHGVISEVIVYPYALSDLQVSNVNFYLTNKYALHDP